MPKSCGAGAPQRICLVSPGHVSFNPRLVKEADALQAAGYRVHVIAAGNVPYLRAYDSEIFAEAKWTWETVSYSGKFHHQFLRARRRFARFLVKRGARNLALLSIAHHLLVMQLAKAAMRHPADLYIAHYVAAIPIVAAAAKRYGGLAGFDAEDFHTGEFDATAKTSPEAVIVETLEQAYLPTFAHFTAASPGIAAAYARLFSSVSPIPVLNVFPLTQAPVCPTAIRQDGDKITAHWFSQTIGENRGLETVLSAMAQARCQIDFYVRGTWQKGYRQKFKDLAQNLGVLDRVHELPLVAPAEIEREAAAYDIGLVCETGHSKNRQIALTNKIFSYMLAGLAVVATDIEAHRQLRWLGIDIRLYQTDDAADLAQLLEHLATDATGLRKLRVETWKIAQDRYNWDFEQRKLIKSVEDVLKKKSGHFDHQSD